MHNVEAFDLAKPWGVCDGAGLKKSAKKGACPDCEKDEETCQARMDAFQEVRWFTDGAEKGKDRYYPPSI